MRALHVKEMDESLMRQIKSAAGLAGKTMRVWIIDALRAALRQKR